MIQEAHMEFICLIFFYSYDEKYMEYFYARLINKTASVGVKKCRITYILSQSFHDWKVLN